MFWGSQGKVIKNLRRPFCTELNFTPFGFFVVFHFKTVQSTRLQTFTAFWPKIAEHDVPKTQFSQKFLDRFFSEILIEDVKLIPNKVLKLSRRYLMSFLSYRENTGGGKIYPSPNGARINFKLYIRLSHSRYFLKEHCAHAISSYSYQMGIKWHHSFSI